LVGLFVLQLLIGAVNVALKAPVAMQLIHLLIADALWILLILLSAAALSPQARPATVSTLVRTPITGDV
jgi:heme A synthase